MLTTCSWQLQVQLLSFGDAPSKLMAAQKITHITCGPDDDAATHRAALLSVDVMHAIIDLMQPTNRAILRTAAAQAFCNLTLAAAEGAEGAERLAVSLPHVASAMKGLLMSDTVKDGALTVCQALCNLSRVPEIVPVLCASLAPLPPLVHHLVTACDATCKARFAQVSTHTMLVCLFVSKMHHLCPLNPESINNVDHQVNNLLCATICACLKIEAPPLSAAACYHCSSCSMQRCMTRWRRYTWTRYWHHTRPLLRDPACIPTLTHFGC